MFIAAAVVLFLLGLLFTSSGLRGRRVSSNPHCGSCGFDLVGIDLANPTAVCPECGAELSARGAIRDGARVRRPRFLAVGILMLILALSLTGITVVTRTKGFDWNTIKPAWLLSNELTSSNQGVATGAIRELGNRLAAGKLSSDRADATMKIVFARQANTAAAWSAPWGNYLEACRSQGMMTPEQVQTYARQAAAVAMESRPKISQGSRLAIRATVRGGRIGDKSNFTLVMRCLETSEAGQVLSKGGAGGSAGLSLIGMSAMGSNVEISGPVGMRTLTSKWRFTVNEGSMTGTPLISWDQSFDIPVEVTPAGTADVEVVEDGSLRPGVEAVLSSSGCEAYPSGAGNLRAGGMINSQGPPIGLGYDVYWRAMDGSAEWKVGYVSFSAGTGASGYGYGGELPKDFKHAKVDVILRPSAKVATETTNIFKIWGGEIVMPGQAVKLPAVEGIR